MAYDFKEIKRCGARCRTKGGAPYLGPAMMHGGVYSRLEKHGRATLKAKAERKQERAFLKQMKHLNKELEHMKDEKPSVDTCKLSHLTDHEINRFFDDLLAQCKKDGIYSVFETSEAMGVPYDQVKTWASTNEDWEYALEMSRCYCALVMPMTIG